MTAHDIQTPATEPEIGAASEPTHGAEIVVPLNRLKASPRNARKVKHSAAAIEALAASIRAKGVLQAPVVEIERDREGAATGNYLVTIGEGRRQALRMLAKRKAIKRTHPVKVVVDTLNDAHEISLDENITREAMHPADQFEAFRKLAEERGYGPEEIAARFGVSAHVARQRLRLGAAAPELMTAYREGTLTLDLLTAFCVSEDQDRQRQVLEQMGPYTSVFAIRRAMTEAKVRADDRRVGFVGLETYEAEGGGLLRDLFTEDGGGWLEDPALLDRLVAEKLTVLAEEARQREGWKWAEACAEFADVADFGRVYPVVNERSEADAAEMAALSAEYDRLISDAEAVEVLPPEVDARLEAIDKALQAYGPDYDYAPEAKARAGVMVMLGHDGLARFERGLVRAEDAALAPPPPWDADEGADGEAPEYVEADDARAGGEEEADEGLAPLSERLLIDLTAHKTMGLRDAVQADVAAALATVVHALALQVFYPGYGDFTPLQLRLSAGGSERLAPGVGDSPAGRRVTDWLDDEATLTFLHATVSTARQCVRLPETPMHLDVLLADRALVGGLAPRLGSTHLRVLTVIGFPTSTWPGLLDELNRLAFDYRWTTRALCLDKTDAGRLLGRIRRQWFAKRKSIAALLKEVMTNEAAVLMDSDADNKAADADQALQDLGADGVGYALVTATLTVWDEDPAIADAKLRQAEKVIQGRDFTCIAESLNAVEAWLGGLPGHVYANARTPPISTLNLAHIMPMSAVWAGPDWNLHLDGPPLFHARTDGATPFRFCHHVGDVGHTLMVGPTGAGKSVLLALMALQFRRYPASQVFAFDFGGSIRAAALAMGGDFHDLGEAMLGGERGLTLQPLEGIDDPGERAWAQTWLIDLLGREGVPIEPEIKDQVWSALVSLAGTPASERTLSGFAALVQSAAVKRAMAPFTLEGPWGRLLDGDREHLGVGAVQAFETEGLIGSGAAPAVLAHLFHRIEARLDGRPTLIIVDEGWIALDDTGFGAQLREWLKTLRKKNASVVFATQSLADIDNSAIAAAIIESCHTRLFLPNARAREPQIAAVYRRFGLNDRQIDILAQATPKRDYYCQSRAGDRLFELGLGPVALAFCAASSATDQASIRAVDYRDAAGVLQRVEVKGTVAAAFSGIELTVNEMKAAKEHGAAYWLCLVAGCETATPRVQMIQDPAAKLAAGGWTAKPILFAVKFAGGSGNG